MTDLRSKNLSNVRTERQDNIGLFVCKAATCIVVGTHDENIQGGNCNTCVGNLADYLLNNGM